MELRLEWELRTDSDLRINVAATVTPAIFTQPKAGHYWPYSSYQGGQVTTHTSALL